MVLTSDAPKVWNLLKGVLCVYKPAGISLGSVTKMLSGNISRDLCELDCRPPVNHVFIEGDATSSLSVTVAPSYADHPLVAGPRYQPKDIRCSWGALLGKNVSGVLLLGLGGSGIRNVKDIHLQRPTRVYRLKGILGKATDNYFISGKVVEKSTYKHVHRLKFDTVLATIQAAHQKQMFQQCGVDMQTQTAYDLAVQGLIKPANGKIPILYGIKCVEFNPPDFEIEVQCINEYEMYLRTLIHELGLELRSNATCTGLRCIRYDTFTLEQALLRKHWKLQYILNNMAQNRKLLKKTKVYERREIPALKECSINEMKVEPVKKDEISLPY